MNIFVILFGMIIMLDQVFANDQTTCMTDFQDDDSLHFMCFCNNNDLDVQGLAQEIELHPGFSLAHFAYNLAGSYFGKSVYITFENCRYLKLVLDHMELSRIGSDFFRPDIQVRGLVVEQVYHLELIRNAPRSSLDAHLPKDEYLIAFPAESLRIELHAVALVRLDAGAKFSSLVTNTDNARLYIDLNHGFPGEEDALDIDGFTPGNTFFITKSQKIRLKEGENFHTRMKEIVALNMSSSASFEVSFALISFAVVIFMGIIGLFVVVAHRQKRKKQLKALLRAKNLGPLLESKQIAQNTGMKYYPQYVQKKQPRDGSRRGGTSPPTPDIDGPDTEVGDHKKWKKLDINDLLAGIMIRIRNNKEQSSDLEKRHGTPRPNSNNTRKISDNSGMKRAPETSFFYKESSLSSKDSSSSANNSNCGHQGQNDLQNHHKDCENVAVQVHRCNSKNEKNSYSISSSASSGSESLSYVSRISQQVFVTDNVSATNNAADVEDVVQYSNKKYQKSHDQILKNKVANFFSSVSISKYNKSHNTKL